MAIASYLIYPKKELTEVMEDYPDFYPRKPVVWRFDEHPHTLPRHRKYYSTQIKFAFLAGLARHIKQINHREKLSLQAKKFKDATQLLFGRPPVFTIENFDKWWTIERIRGHQDYPRELLMLKSDDFKSLPQDGIEFHESMLKGFIHLLEKLETLPKDSDEREGLIALIIGSFPKSLFKYY